MTPDGADTRATHGQEPGWPNRNWPDQNRPGTGRAHMSTEYCKAERDGHLLIVTMNRPERMNALHPPANFELAKIFDEFAADPDLWVAIITGAGDRAFSAGNDLKYQAGGNKIEVPPTG